MQRKSEVDVVSHGLFKTFPLPAYPEIRLAFNLWKIKKIIKDFNPDAIHIATPEGTIGLAARHYCKKLKLPYTTAYHTKMPEYISERFPIPLSWSFAYMRDS